MEIDFAAKLLALLVGVLGLPKLWHAISERRRAKLKDQLSNSKELVASLGYERNALVVQSAYMALTGRKPLHPADIHRLMLLEEPLRAFLAFQTGHAFLRRSTGRRSPYCFKQKYESRKYRSQLVVGFSVGYFAFAVAAATPLLFAGQIFGAISGYTLLGLVAWAFVLSWMAKVCLSRLEGLLSAQRLLRMKLARSLRGR